MWDNKSDMLAKHDSLELFSCLYIWIWEPFEPRALISLRVCSFDTCWKKSSPTIDEDGGGVTSPAGDDVFGHARVVARVCKPSFFDDKIMVSRDDKIGVACRVDNILVSLPLHLKICFSGQNSLQLNWNHLPPISHSSTVTVHAGDERFSHGQEKHWDSTVFESDKTQRTQRFSYNLFSLREKSNFYFVAAGEFVSETDQNFCSFCAFFQKPKLLLFLFWCTLRLPCLFSCSHLTLCRLQSSYTTAALLLVLLLVVKPHIIGISSSRMLPLFSPVVTFALMFFLCWTAVGTFLPIPLQTAPTLLSCDWLVSCSWSLGCLSGWPNLLLCCYQSS